MKSLFQKYINNVGFTVIELIVTIAIIAVLSGVVMSNISVHIAKSRDARRKEDLMEIRKALILYVEDHRVLPTSGFGSGNIGQGAATNYNDGTLCYSYGSLENFLDGTDPDIPSPQKNYFKIPHDPKCGGCSGCNSSPAGYMYYYISNKCAVLFAALEKPTQEDLNTCNNVCYPPSGPATYGMNYCLEVRIQ